MALFTSYWAVLYTLSSLAILLLGLRWLFRPSKNLPPGPWELPFLGSLPTIAYGVWQGLEPCQIFGRLAERYGPVLRVGLFNRTLVILDDIEVTRAAFQHPQLSDRPKSMGEGVSGASGEPWVQMRHFSLSVLRGLGVGKSSFEERIATEGRELLHEVSATCGRPFHPKAQVSSAVSNVICSVVLGERYEYNDRDFVRLLKLMSTVITSIGTGGLLFFFPGLAALPILKAKYQKLLDDYSNVHNFLRGIINIHRANLNPHSLNDYVDLYLMEIERNAGRVTDDGATAKPSLYGKLNDTNLHFTVVDLFAAGSETTVTTIEWCILYMTIYPDLQRRVQAEIDAVVGRNRLPRLADKPELNFTHAVIWEVQRMTSIVPMGLPHVAACDTQFHGFVIPKGAIIFANLWRISRDPKYWKEPEKFNPERFLDDDGKAFKPDHFIPFGLGRRMCLGEHLAKMELFIFFSYFMHRYTFKKPPNDPPLSLKGISSLTYSPLPFKICAVERD